MFLFIENLAGLYIASHSRELSESRIVRIVSPYVAGFASSAFGREARVLVLPRAVTRVLKPLLGLLQVPIIQQDPTSLAFRLSLWKRVLSDGLMTDYLVRELRIPVRRFYSMRSMPLDRAPRVPGCAIIGSNWLEFGSMTEATYRAHLCWLHRQYPEAKYYCHPKERNELPDVVFGPSQVRRPTQPVEACLLSEGVPARLIGVVSSSLLGLAIASGNSVVVDLISMPSHRFDGRKGDTIERLARPIRGCDRLTVGALQAFLAKELADQKVDFNVVTEGC